MPNRLWHERIPFEITRVGNLRIGSCVVGNLLSDRDVGCWVSGSPQAQRGKAEAKGATRALRGPNKRNRAQQHLQQPRVCVQPERSEVAV